MGLLFLFCSIATSNQNKKHTHKTHFNQTHNMDSDYGINRLLKAEDEATAIVQKARDGK